MGGSVLYTDAAAKKRKIVTAKASNCKAKRVTASTIAEPELEAVHLIDGTEKKWLHDLCQCVLSPGKYLAATGGTGSSAHLKAHLAIREVSIRKALHQGLSFCFTGELAACGRTMNSWKQVRTLLKENIVRDNLSVLTSVAGIGIDAESATGSEIAESIVKLLNAGDDGAEGANVHLSETPALLIADLHPVITCENAKSGVEFFNNNGNLMLAPELCSAYQRISKDVVHTLEGNTGELSFDDIYNCILDHTFDAVPNFLHFIAAVFSQKLLIDPAMEIQAATGGFFETQQQASRLLRVRASWVLDMLQCLATGEHKMTGNNGELNNAADGNTFVQVMRDNVDFVCRADATFVNGGQMCQTDWRSFWMELENHMVKPKPEMKAAIRQTCDGICAANEQAAPKADSPEVSKQAESAPASATAKSTKAKLISMIDWQKKNRLFEMGDVVKVFMQELQAFVDRATILGIWEQPEDRRRKLACLFKPDSGLKSYGTLEGDDKTFVAALPLPDISISFRGTVVRVPGKGSLPLCSALGHDFYLQCPANNNTYGSEEHCVAWEIKDMKIPTRPKETDPKPSLQILRTNSNFHFSYYVANQQHDTNASVTLFTLVNNCDFKPTREEFECGYVKLLKEPIAEAARPPKQVKAPKVKSGIDQKWNSFKYLLR